MKNIFAVLQKIGRSFMLPIAILPMAGTLFGIGGAFTSPVLIETYNLTFLRSGTPLNYILILFFNAGNFVFANLPLLFAVGIAIGMADKSKETAAPFCCSWIFAIPYGDRSYIKFSRLYS